jgi:PilZ domain
MSGEHGHSGMERRVAERVDLAAEVRWRRLKISEAGALEQGPAYSGLAAFPQDQDSVTEEGLERQAYSENLSVTGLKLVGDLRLRDGSALKVGWELLVEMVPPGQVEPIRALAEVVWVTPPAGPPPRQAGLFFKAVNKEDVERIVRERSAGKGPHGA